VDAADFQAQIQRGVVIHLTLDQSVLDDPEITSRDKFIVVLNALCPDDPTYFVMATSNIARFNKAPHLSLEAVLLDDRRYAFLNRPTALDFTSVKALSLIDLTTMGSKGIATIVGTLHADDLAKCDEVIRRSRFIEPRVVPLILPGSYF
jgi:hypothetical protein